MRLWRGVSLSEQLHLEYFHPELTTPPPHPPHLSFHHPPRLLIRSLLLVLLGRGEHPFVARMDPFPLKRIKSRFKMAELSDKLGQHSFGPQRRCLFHSCLQNHLFELETASVFSLCSRSACNQSAVCLFRGSDCL